MFKHILALECNFMTYFCRFGVWRTFPTDQHLRKFGFGEGGLGGRGLSLGGLMDGVGIGGFEDWRIDGLEVDGVLMDWRIDELEDWWFGV